MLFDVTPDHVAALADSDLRTLIGRLCEAEVRSRGCVPVGVTYGGDQNAADGGVDVRAEVPTAASGGFVPRPLTVFQVKAEDMPRSAIAVEMRPNAVLRSSIASLAANGGAYVIVSSKGSVADAPLRDRLSAMRDAVADNPDAAALHLDFYDRTRIATWVNGHPSEVVWVRDRVGEPLSGWRPFGDWSRSPELVGAPYLLDGGVRLVACRPGGGEDLTAERGIGALRSILRAPRGVVRLVGLSGVGKTRLVQALFDLTLGTDALDATSAIYTDLGNGPDPQPLDIIARLEASGRPHVLVVDNCGADLHGRLARRVSESAAPISLITIEYDLREDQPEATEVFRLEPASDEILEKMLERRHPTLTGAERAAIASFASGNPQIAMLVAATAPGDGSLADLGDRALFERLFYQGQAKDPDFLRAAQVLSLVYSFDGEVLDQPDADLPILASLVGMAPEHLYRHVAELLRRQLVQRRARWRAVLPHALAHRLAKEALQDIPAPIIRAKLLLRADSRLLRSFSRRLGGLHDSAEAQKLVTCWLSEDGRLADVGALDELGLVLLENVAPVSPEGVLRAIRRAAGGGIETLARGEERAQRIVRLLRSIAYDPAHFDEAAALIAAFAAGRSKSNYDADARNVFASLFHAYLSGTHATAAQRADLLRRVGRGEVAGGPGLALDGLHAMLECAHFSSSLPFEFGSRRRDYGLEPRGTSVRDWFRVALSLARELGTLPDLAGAVRRAVGLRFADLALKTGAAEEALALARTLAADGGWIEGWARARAAEREARRSGREAEAAALAGLAADLQPACLVDLVAAYVLDDDLALLDAEDDPADHDAFGRALARLDGVRVQLARDLASDEAALDEVLPRLVTCQRQAIGTFGRELGRETRAARDMWSRIVGELTRLGSATPVGGFAACFLRGIAERDRDLADELLDEALRTEALHHIFVHLQAGVGLEGRAMDRLVEAAVLPTVPVRTFQLLAIGGVTGPVPGGDLRRLLGVVAGREGGVGSALEVMRMRLYSLRQAGVEVGIDDRAAGVEIMDRVPFGDGEGKRDRGCEEVAAGCFVAGEHDDAARRICLRIREAVGARKVRHWDVARLITAFARTFPRVVLDVFVAGDAPRPGKLDAWGGERHGPRGGILGQVEDDVLVAWAQENPDVRFEALARVIQPWTGGPGTEAAGVSDEEEPRDWSSIGLRLVREARDPIAVLSVYQHRLRPSSWVGSFADALTSRIRLLDTLLHDPDERIRAWTVPTRAALLDEAARARECEDAEAKERDQRFEW